MATARQVFEAKKLAAKYGVVGKVAGLYVTAGFDVKVEGSEHDMPYHFTATRKGEKYMVRVYWKSGQVPTAVVEELAAKASEAGARGVLALYGSGPRVAKELVEKAREAGVSIKRVRF